MVVRSKPIEPKTRIVHTDRRMVQRKGVVDSYNESWVWVLFEGEERPKPCFRSSLRDAYGKPV